jgi:hypothetical protein
MDGESDPGVNVCQIINPASTTDPRAASPILFSAWAIFPGDLLKLDGRTLDAPTLDLQTSGLFQGMTGTPSRYVGVE